MFSVVGSGFGLYGYVPAIIEKTGEAVLLPEAYRESFEKRPELARYAPKIRWVADRDEALAQADAVAIATRPADQPAIVEACLAHPRIGTLLLEKPLAATPGDAARALAALESSGRRYRIGYTPMFAKWAGELA